MDFKKGGEEYNEEEEEGQKKRQSRAMRKLEASNSLKRVGIQFLDLHEDN